MKPDIVPLSETHRHAVIDIFNHYIENSFAAYLEKKVPYDFYDIFLSMMKGYPSAAIVIGGETVGFCFLRSHNPLPAFARTADITYFIHRDHTGKGLGSSALEHLVEAAGQMKIDTIMASVSSLNESSLRFHVKHGFTESGRFIRIGKKFNRDFDVVWFQKNISTI